jgi:hypothetical protein
VGDAQVRLAKYHELAVIQGRQSFGTLLSFSAIGFCLLGFVVWKAAGVKTTAGGIGVGMAGASGAAMTAYISKHLCALIRKQMVDWLTILQNHWI